MLKQLFELFRQVFTFGDRLQRLDDKVKEHSEQIRNLADTQARIYYESQLQRERDARERERQSYERKEEALRLENQMLRERLERLERLSLPAPPADQTSPDEKSEKE
ncbi:MAG: hypothetical protein ACRD9Y_10040 [Blastocatellia bacterium]